MTNPFFKNYGPIKALEIYKILNLKPNNEIFTQNITDIKDLAHSKKNELEALFDKINPIIQNYMKENSIEILMNSKNIFIGNIKADLTQLLINEINSKVEN